MNVLLKRMIKGLLKGSPFLLALAVHAAPLDAGSKRITLHAKDGSRVEIGQVVFAAPATDGRASFTVKLDHAPFKDYFLSMREFKCLDGQGEVFCHVPYPYASPQQVAAGDLAWLEHALMFMFKKPSEFGAKLWNGVYFRLKATERGFVGEPQAIDLNVIGAPPARLDVPPFKPALRDDMQAGARWFEKVTIE